MLNTRKVIGNRYREARSIFLEVTCHLMMSLSTFIDVGCWCFASSSVAADDLIDSTAACRTHTHVYLGRPEPPFRTGLCFTPYVFFRHAFSEVPRPIALKLSHMVGIWPNFIIPLQKFGGGRERSPQKNWGPKTCKISPEPLTISKFGRRYKFYKLWQFLLGLMKKGPVNFGPLTAWNYMLSLDPLKCTIWGYYISAVRGCCAMKFLHALEIDQGYLAHTPTGTGVPSKNFNRENIKNLA